MLYINLLIHFLFLFSFSDLEYEIVEVYKGIVPEEGTVVLTSFNNIEKAELILIPVKINEGKYSVKVTRKSKDLHSVDGLNIFIKTRFCKEYSVNADAVLIISSGGLRGKIVFSE